MYWDRANNYGAKCYGLEYAEQPLLMDTLGGVVMGVGKSEATADPFAECTEIPPPGPAPELPHVAGNWTMPGRPDRRWGSPPYDPTWPNPAFNLCPWGCSEANLCPYRCDTSRYGPDRKFFAYQATFFNAEAADYDQTHCKNTMTTLPLSENPLFFVCFWGPPCTYPPADPKSSPSQRASPQGRCRKACPLG